MSITHLFIPDTQVKYGVPTNHITALSNYILDKKPTKIIIAGDWWDMPATSRWNSPLEQEGMTIEDDIHAGNAAMRLLMAPIKKYNESRTRWKKKRYNPPVYFTMGNHEAHLDRLVEAEPKLKGLIGYHLLNLECWDIKVIPFLIPIEIDGIWYCHFFCNPNTGKGYSGMMETRLKNIGHSFTQGHLQGFQYGNRILPNGHWQYGLVAGSFYQHDETYKKQSNHHWRGVVMKHEVENGMYDVMQVSLNFLLKRYL